MVNPKDEGLIIADDLKYVLYDIRQMVNNANWRNAVHSTYDYGNRCDFAFANHVIADDGTKIGYRIFLTVMKKGDST